MRPSPRDSRAALIFTCPTLTVRDSTGDNWNTFDFCVIVVCLLPFDSSGAAVLRLLRLLRVMKMFKSLPQLQIILNGLASGVSAITYVGVLMLLLYYLCAARFSEMGWGWGDPLTVLVVAHHNLLCVRLSIEDVCLRQS